AQSARNPKAPGPLGYRPAAVTRAASAGSVEYANKSDLQRNRIYAPHSLGRNTSAHAASALRQNQAADSTRRHTRNGRPAGAQVETAASPRRKQSGASL